jgi:hypothetical protein
VRLPLEWVWIEEWRVWDYEKLERLREEREAGEVNC